MTATATATTTINHLFVQRAQEMPDTVALRRKVDGSWEDITWKGYYDAARKIGLGLRALGLEKGQTAAILSNTRAEWAFADLGILCVGGITVPIYQSNLPEEVEYILDNSDAKFLILEDLDQWVKCKELVDEGKIEAIKHFVIMETGDSETVKAADCPYPEGDERFLTLDQLLEKGEGEDEATFAELAQQATRDDPVTYIYTSGTTGKPKGVVLTHGNAMGEAEALDDGIDITTQDVTLAFLPLAHVFARALHWTQIKIGYVTAFAEAIPKVVDNMGEVKPTFFAAVPRIYEKIHQAVTAKINANTGFKKSYALWALEGALQTARIENEGQSAGLGLALRNTLGGPVLNKVKAGLQERTGGRIKFFISGGAPLSPEIAFFLKAMGFTVLEGYGLTETTAATHINRPEACKLGTVGKVVKGVECKIAPDGEILTRGTVIMKEYYQRPEATAEVLKDGWFHTGDIGVIDAQGFLKITDRKKDLIITAAGKNIAPQNVENHIKTHPLISQIAMFGDKKKFCVALLTLDEEAIRKALADAGHSVPATMAEIAADPNVQQMVQAAIDEKNSHLPSYETIKYFDILPADFEVGKELTPTLKVKRKKVSELYADRIEKLYSAHGG
ncbi:MAG TPA: long-chain fatty acid--CoA ligase [Planctomycetes bacterium]|nr:long-chain fatty acid--CoA ligase [Planctomycetota bacterium]